MAAPSTRLAYLLVSDTQGLLCHNTFAYTPVLPSNLANVSDFRRAVKADNVDILRSISPSQLRVYKNLKSFDAGQDPLDPRSLMDPSFGKDDENALVVAVPAPFGMWFLVDMS